MDRDVFCVGLTCQMEVGGLARLARHPVVPAHKVYPRSQQILELAAPITGLLRADERVLSISATPVLGRYGQSQELSLGLEVEVLPDFEVQSLAGTLFGLARRHDQTDAFVARVLHDDEWADNTRPGLTVTLTEPRTIGQLRGLIDRITGFAGEGWPIDGFTTLAAPGMGVGWVGGLRYVFLPEISIRWDGGLRRLLTEGEHAMDIVLLDQATKIGRISQALADDPLVAEARLNWFDIIVGGIEDYADIIHRLEASREAGRVVEGWGSRRAFSELLGLTNRNVLESRLAHIARDERSRRARQGLVAAADDGEDLREAGNIENLANLGLHSA